MRAIRTAPGLRPLTLAERKRIRRENDRALFPSVVVQRLLATIDALEVSAEAAGEATP